MYDYIKAHNLEYLAYRTKLYCLPDRRVLSHMRVARILKERAQSVRRDEIFRKRHDLVNLDSLSESNLVLMVC
jgi:hypothetical protein